MATAPSTEISLLSLSDAKIWLGSTGTTDYDGIICDLINSVSLRFEAETGRKLKSRSYTEEYNGSGKNYLYLYNYPLSSTTITVTIDEARAFTSTDDRVTSTDIILSTESGKVELDGHTFSSGQKNIQVAYTAGYSTSDEFNLIQAAKECVKLMFARYTGKMSVGVRSEGYEGGTRTYENDLPWSVKRVLDMYRDVRVV